MDGIFPFEGQGMRKIQASVGKCKEGFLQEADLEAECSQILVGLAVQAKELGLF